MNVNVFGYENKVYPIYLSKKFHKHVLNLLSITQDNKSHHVFIKDFNKLMYSNTKHKHRKRYCMQCLESFTTEVILSNHKKQCLLINGTEAVNYESERKKFKNYDNQVPIPFKIYADTECFLKRTNSYEDHHTIRYQGHYSNSIGAKLVCIGDKFSSPVIIFKGDYCINKFIKWIFSKKKEWINQVIYHHFNKELIMTTQDEEIYDNLDIVTYAKKN